MAWGGILTLVKKRDSLEVCAGGGGILGSVGNQTRGRGNDCFAVPFKHPGPLEICLWPRNNEFYVEESCYIGLRVALQSLHLNFSIKSVKHINWRLFQDFLKVGISGSFPRGEKL